MTLRRINQWLCCRIRGQCTAGRFCSAVSPDSCRSGSLWGTETTVRVKTCKMLALLEEHSVRQFLLTNLVEQNGHYAWRVNLDAISAQLDDIMSFPDFSNTYEGPTLFLGGASSAYISSDDYPEIQRLFPCADIQYIPDASHWIHADKPLDFISSIISFLQS